MIFVGILVGLLVGGIIGFMLMAGCQVTLDRQAITNGYVKLCGKIYKISEIDGGKE